ncbi:zinc-binding dehydrogenase [Mycobacterium yunnanensis]|uniref:Zinc-binding dehydrogenase n=1 Tax=Mycobacterium yunnanensis TaxID=368477 RepID=A0A9X3BTL2_9MYCO|nr:zinc-binding dehydrogenase [Mycobacterium yunnanensis]MCV7421774.1 zinc-binding dehydrogenase [Mycobacterium yunnanensis]
MSGVVRIHRQGGPEVLEYGEETLPSPGAGDVLLVHDHIGVNFVDTMFRDGTFPLRDFPVVLGLEAAGSISSVGVGVDGWRVGDRVAYWTTLGAYAEQRLIAADQLVAIPDDVTTEAATAVLTKGLLSWALTRLVVTVEPGDTVVVGPAAGGVGTILSRWLKAMGANVIATVGSLDKRARVRDAGIDTVLVSPTPGDAADAIVDLVGPRGVDVLFDGVGGAGFARLWPLVTRGGTAVLFGGAAGYPDVDVESMTATGVRFVRPSTGEYVNTPALIEQGSAAVFDALRHGVFGDITATVHPLREVARAHVDLSSRRTTGSVLLTP